MQPSEEIKAKLNIVDVIRDYIQLQAAGVNFRAKCPFHRENTPSFVVSPEKQIYHCFGCGEGGDLITFVMKMEGIEFVEAMRLLAPKAGVVLKRENPEQVSRRTRLIDMLDMSRRYYHQIFLQDKAAQSARAYLEKRGLTPDTIAEWQIGYSPEAWDNVGQLLRKRGYKEIEIFQAGLTVKSEKNNRYYDRFRGRIMFPVNDANGVTVGFSARVSPEREATEVMGKYINSPQSDIYDKSKILFGLDKAKHSIKKEDSAIVVEGQMDCISAHQAGFKNTVASSGTALAADQITLLKRFSNNIALSFDMDSAGEMAAERGIAQAMNQEMNIRIIEVFNGKDPDECIRQNPEDWRHAVTEAKSMMQYYFDKTLGKLDLKKVEDKRQGAKVLLPMIAKLKNVVEKDHWLKILSENLDVREQLLRESLSSPKKPAMSKAEEKNEPMKKNSREERLCELLIALALKFGLYFGYLTNNLQNDHIVGSQLTEFYKYLIIYYNKTSMEVIAADGNIPSINANGFKEWLNSDFFASNNKTNPLNHLQLLDKLIILGEEEFFELEEASAKNEIIKLILDIKKNYYSKKMKEIEKAIIQAERIGSKSEVMALMEEMKSFSDELREL